MTIKQPTSDSPRPVTFRQALSELDDYIAECDGQQHYDVESGLAELRSAIAAERVAHHVQIAERTPALAWKSAGVRRMIVAQYAETLLVTFLTITSPNTSEFAARLGSAAGEERWTLSWWAGRSLTRQQAVSAMVLNELLVLYELDSDSMLLVMRDLATDLDAPLTDILNRLSTAKHQVEQRINPTDPHWWPSPRTLDMWREAAPPHPTEQPSSSGAKPTGKELREAN